MNPNKDLLNPSRQVVISLLVVFTVLGIGLRLHQLGSGLWFDEIQTLVSSVRQPLAQIMTHYPGNNDHLLYSVLAHLSIAAFGEHAWSLRLPAVIFGVAAIPMLYVLGASVSTRLEALAAASLLAISYHHIWFSQNARGYTALLFCTLLATHLLLRGLRDRRRSTFVAYAVVAALGAYTHLTMVFVVVSHALIVAWQALPSGKRTFDAREWLNPALGFVLAGLLTLALHAPILLDVQAFFARESPAMQAATPGWALWEALRGLRIGFATGWGVVLAGLLFVTGCWSYFRQSPAVCALFLVPAPFILAAALVLHHPVRPRFFFLLMGFGLLIAVRGAVVIGRFVTERAESTAPGRRLGEKLPAALVVGMIVLSAFALPYGYRYPKQDFEQALRFVEGARKAGDSIAVVGVGTATPYKQYYMRPWPKVDNVEELQSALAAHDAVWLLFTFSSYIVRRDPALMNAIQTGCVPARTFPGTVAGGDIEVFECGRSAKAEAGQ
jgi:hypothetical protein